MGLTKRISGILFFFLILAAMGYAAAGGIPTGNKGNGHTPVIVPVPGQGDVLIVNGEAIPVQQLIDERDALQAKLDDVRQNKGQRISQCISSCHDRCLSDIDGQEDTYTAHIETYDTLLGATP